MAEVADVLNTRHRQTGWMIFYLCRLRTSGNEVSSRLAGTATRWRIGLRDEANIVLYFNIKLFLGLRFQLLTSWSPWKCANLCNIQSICEIRLDLFSFCPQNTCWSTNTVIHPLVGEFKWNYLTRLSGQHNKTNDENLALHLDNVMVSTLVIFKPWCR